MSTLMPANETEASYYAGLYRSYLRRSHSTLNRMNRNWGLYSGVDYKQWDPDQVQQLINEAKLHPKLC